MDAVAVASMDGDRVLMSRAAFSRWSGIPLTTLKGFEKKGLLRPVWLGGRPYYTRQHLYKLIRENLASPRNEPSHRPGSANDAEQKADTPPTGTGESDHPSTPHR